MSDLSHDLLVASACRCVHGATHSAACQKSAGFAHLTFLLVLVSLAVMPPLAEPAALAAEANGRHGAAVTFDSLLSRFRASPGLFAHYREEKRIALLAEPLVSEGTVHYAPPRRIARHASTPSPSSIVFDGALLRFGDGTTEQQVDVRAAPVARAFIESFLGVLAGDRALLERTFTVDFRAGDEAHPGDTWGLALVPRDPSLLGILREVRFEGAGVVVSQMRIRETSGDEGVTTFSDVDAARHYSVAEASRVFRISGDGAHGT